MIKLTSWQKCLAIPVLSALMAIASAAQTLTTLARFNGVDGSDPYFAPLLQGADGNFYGTTAYGGANCSPYGCGTVFKITAKGVLTTLYSFCTQSYCSDGNYPYSGLIQATDGNFYGTTSQGGPSGHGGTIFKITPAGKLTTLYSFCTQTDCTDGAYVPGGLMQGADGNFYGTTFSGGIPDSQYCLGGCGTIFKITPQGKLTTLHSFAGYPTEGSAPNAGLMQATNGNFYGTTTSGGAFDGGTVFEITPRGTLTTLHSFGSSATDGVAPYASLVLGRDGDLYGTTSAGGSGSDGTVFKITRTGTLTTLYSFCSQTGCTDGAQPEANLTLGTDGNLYGTASRGGAYGEGLIFNVTSGGTISTLYNFCSGGYPACPDGLSPYSGLLQATSGNFLGGTISGGGAFGAGTIFSFSLGLAPFVETMQVSGNVGAQISILGDDLTGTTGVTFHGISAQFTVLRPSLILAEVPIGATSGFVIVTTPRGQLKSKAQFQVNP
jgi:uncharacterized repeat protein (TIGR03803 family)